MIYLPAARHSQIAPNLRPARSLMSRLTAWLHAKAQEAESENELARLNDHMLRDIGLTRHETLRRHPTYWL